MCENAEEEFLVKDQMGKAIIVSKLKMDGKW
jgi:hypothetical protein